jgi:hypothetical protein
MCVTHTDKYFALITVISIVDEQKNLSQLAIFDIYHGEQWLRLRFLLFSIPLGYNRLRLSQPRLNEGSINIAHQILNLNLVML